MKVQTISAELISEHTKIRNKVRYFLSARRSSCIVVGGGHLRSSLLFLYVKLPAHLPVKPGKTDVFALLACVLHVVQVSPLLLSIRVF